MDDYYILILGYFVVGLVYVVVLFSILRLYYEIRYGETLENKI
jgi:hypothetical protein